MVSPLERIVVGEAVIITALRMAWMALRQVGWIPAVSWRGTFDANGAALGDAPRFLRLDMDRHRRVHR